MNVDVTVRRHSAENSFSYPDLDALQRRFALDLAGDPAFRPQLIVAETAPVVTYGKRTPESAWIESREEIASRGIELLEVDRGGLATYHGPGQWVVFYVDRIERLTGDPKGVRKSVQFLLERSAEVVRAYRDSVNLGDGDELGVWSEKGKAAALGVRISKGVLLHGVCINGFRTPQSFFGIRPCGLEKPVDFLIDQPSETEFVALRDRIIACFSESQA